MRGVISDGAVDLGPSGFDAGHGYRRIDVIQSLELAETGACSADEDCDTSTGADDGFWAMDQEDGDGDGYGDACDDCPNTPADSEVRADGCPWFVLIIEPREEPGQPSPMKEGAETTVEATPAPEGFIFDHWEGDVPAGHEFDNPLQIIMDSNKSLALFSSRLGARPTARRCVGRVLDVDLMPRLSS